MSLMSYAISLLVEELVGVAVAVPVAVVLLVFPAKLWEVVDDGLLRLLVVVVETLDMVVLDGLAVHPEPRVIDEFETVAPTKPGMEVEEPS